MKHATLVLLLCLAAHTSFSQDNMNKKMENKTDKMNKHMDNPGDKMNKKITDTLNDKRYYRTDSAQRNRKIQPRRTHKKKS